MNPNTGGRSLILKAVYLVFTATTLFLALRHRAYDDPFITYRYAANLHQGHGFVYNPGERVQSTTTPFFALMLAVLSIFWDNLPYLANLIGALSLAMGGLLLWELAAFWQAPWAGWAGLLLYPIFPLAITPLGSETPLYVMFCLAAIVAYFRHRFALAAACAALATLTRPDGVLVGLVLAADFAWQFFRAKDKVLTIPWKAMGLFVGMLLPWFIFAWIYFGSPLPVTLAAKQQQGAMVVSQRFAEGFLSTVRWYQSWRYKVEALSALAGLYFVLREARRGSIHRQWLRFLAWPIVYFAAFSLLGVSRYFWYYTPLVPGFLIFSGLGLQALAEASFRLPSRYLEWTILNRIKAFGLGLGKAIYRRFPIWRVYPGFIDGLRQKPMQTLSFVLLAALFLAQASGLPRLRNPDARLAIYRAAGNWLAANTSVNASVGALEVGILGYYARRPMVDFAGLIQPEVAAQLTNGSDYEYAARWAVEHYQPGYLVLFQGDFPQLEREYAARLCRVVKEFNASHFGSTKNLSIYSCP